MVFSLISISSLLAQCNIHIYQCSRCGKNSQGTSSPSYGSCPDNQGDSHHWRDAGLTPECQRLYNEAIERFRIQEEKALAECEKNKIKTYKGGTVKESFCPSGFPKLVSYQNGIIEEYDESRKLLVRETPKDGGYWFEQFSQSGSMMAKGWVNANGKKDGEWYFTTFNNYSFLGGGGESCENCSVVYKEGTFLGIGTKEEVEAKKLAELMQNEFSKCYTIEDFRRYRTNYPNSEFDGEAIIEINKIKERQEKEALAEKKRLEEKAYVDPLIAKWNTIQDKASVCDTFWNEYFQKYPNGTYYSKIKSTVAVVENNKIQTKEICVCDYKNLNQITSNDGSVPLSYSIAMEIKQKFGINIFRYMNYSGQYTKSFLFLEHYPNFSNDEEIKDLKRLKDIMMNSNKTLSYRISNGKLSEILIYSEENINMAGDKIVYKTKFTFNKEGKIKTFSENNKNTSTYEGYKFQLEFDENGKIINNKYDGVNMEMFQ